MSDLVLSCLRAHVFLFLITERLPDFPSIGSRPMCTSDVVWETILHLVAISVWPGMYGFSLSEALCLDFSSFHVKNIRENSKLKQTNID